MNRPVSLQKFAALSLAAIASASLIIGITGCSMGTIDLSGPVAEPSASGSALKGVVMGGQQPVTSSTLQLYAAGAPSSGGGYGAGATALFAVKNGTTAGYFPGGQPGCVASTNPLVTCTQLPTTDANGSFNITGDYTCPSSTTNVYLVATGGNPQVGGTTSNQFISLMVALGPCSTLSQIPYITLNEITTIAGVYALNQFMSAPATGVVEGIGAPGTTYNGVQSGIVGLTNAFQMVNNISNSANGSPTTTNAAVIILEASQINTLADIIASCANSDPNGTVASGNCSALMSAATPTGKTTATDTLQAAYYMIHNPYNNVAALYALIPTSPPFSAQATPGPVDFTMEIQMEPNYTNTASGGVPAPALGEGVAISFDAYGNAWILNKGYSGTYVVAPSITEIGQNGSVLIYPVSAYNAQTVTTGTTPANYGAYGEFLSTSLPATNIRSFTSTGGVIAIDTLGNAWITNKGDTTGTVPYGSSVAVFSGGTGTNVLPTAGTNGSGTGYYVGFTPDGIAIDGSNNVFIASTGNAVNQTNTAGIAAGKAIDEFIGGVGTAFTYSANVGTGGKTAAPYSLLGGNTKLAIDTNTAVTNSFSGGTTADGPVLYAVAETDCTVSSLAYGTIHQYTTQDLYPTLNSVLSAAPFTVATPPASTCPTTAGVISFIPANSTSGPATSDPNGVAIDKNNNVWLTNSYASTTSGFDGLTYIQTTAATDAVNATYGAVTFDPGGVGVKGNTLTQPYYFYTPYEVVVDGANNAFIGNNGVNWVTEAFAPTAGTSTTAPTFNTVVVPGGTKIDGHQASSPQSLAIDPSGNIWSVNAGNVASSAAVPLAGSVRGNLLNILVGLGAPVVTPTSVAIANKKLGQEP